MTVQVTEAPLDRIRSRRAQSLADRSSVSVQAAWFCEDAEVGAASSVATVEQRRDVLADAEAHAYGFADGIPVEDRKPFEEWVAGELTAGNLVGLMTMAHLRPDETEPAPHVVEVMRRLHAEITGA